MMNKPRILIVDDLKANLIALEKVLMPLNCAITKARSGNEALALTLEEEFCVIITDINMPEMNGYEMVKLLRSQEKNKYIPIIFLTAAYTSPEDQLRGYELGAVDFLLKPINEYFLIQKVKVFLDLYNQRKALENALFERQKLQSIINLDHEYPEIIGNSPGIHQMFKLMNSVINTDVTVLIQGESGTGKELVAKAIHEKGLRKDGPFIRCNCAALPESLMESELFGHEKGAFTGAEDRKLGRFELAENGTLFIDEIGELSFNAQVKLLRVLQEKEFERVGGIKTITANVRMVVATNRNLAQMVNEGKFREDLYYRLNQFPILVPSLRDRKEDIPALTDYFFKKYCKEYQKQSRKLSPESLQALQSYQWKGNIRELQNIIARAVLICDSDVITPESLNLVVHGVPCDMFQEAATQQFTEETLCNLYAKKILKQCNGNKKETARILGITFKTLLNRINH